MSKRVYAGYAGLEYKDKFFLYKTGIYGNKAGQRISVLFKGGHI